MCKTLELSQQTAKEEYEKADANGKKLIQKLFPKEKFYTDIKDRVSEFQDVIDLLGITKEELIYKVLNYTGDDPRMNNISGYAQVILGAEVLNEDWKPDFTDGKHKYLPYFRDTGSGLSLHVIAYWRTLTFAGARPFFKDTALAAHAVKCFPEAYKKFNTY